MNKPLTKFVMAAVAAAGIGMVSASEVDAAHIKFRYTFTNGEFVEGTAEGDIGTNGYVSNFSNVEAIYSGEPSVTLTKFIGTPTFKLGKVEDATTSPLIRFNLSNDLMNTRFGVNTAQPAFPAYFTRNSTGTFVNDLGDFGTWHAKKVPTPALLPGLLALAGGAVRKKLVQDRQEQEG